MILAPYPRSRDTQNPRKKLRKCKKKKDFSVVSVLAYFKNRLFGVDKKPVIFD